MDQLNTTLGARSQTFIDMKDTIKAGMNDGTFKNDQDVSNFIIDAGYDPEDYLEANKEYNRLIAKGKNPKDVSIPELILKTTTKGVSDAAIAISNKIPITKEDIVNRAKLLSSLKKYESQRLMEQADLLGIPLGVPDTEEYEYPAHLIEGKPSKKRAETTLVIEFGSLWASPLCGDLLRRSGCRVIKIESLSRPDGARRGAPGFFDLLNGGKESLSVDFNDDKSLEFLKKILIID